MQGKNKEMHLALFQQETNEDSCSGVTVQMSFLAVCGGQRLLCNESGTAFETLSAITQKVHSFLHLSHDLFIGCSIDNHLIPFIVYNYFYLRGFQIMGKSSKNE